jgi:hypothetical protein
MIELCAATKENLYRSITCLSSEENMKANGKELRREEILALAHQAKLMFLDGEQAYLNDLATDKELLAFARLLEAKHSEAQEAKAQCLPGE